MTLTYFTARSNLVIQAFLWEKVKTVDFSEIIAASDLKVGRCKIIEIMKVSLVLKVKVIFSSPEPLGSQGELIVYPSSRRPSVRPSSVRRPS